MAQLGRPGISSQQRSELWSRWQNGESVSDIARALQKNVGSIFGVFRLQGGYAPKPRSRRAIALTLGERECISRGLSAGLSIRAIAAELERSPSTVSRDIKNNGGRVHVGINRVGRIMKSADIAGISPRRFRKTTDSNHNLPIAPNLLERRVDVAQIGGVNRAWVGDITYIPTREGWLYLAVVLDLASRYCVGYSIDTTMERSLVIDALHSAIERRKPAASFIFHSDRGVQYASNDYRELLEANKIRASMSRKGDCWDNACAESFFGSMKREFGDPIWETREAARAAIFHYIEVWYNRVRRHSSLDYTSPEQFESSLPIAA